MIDRYTLSARLLHWLMAIGFVLVGTTYRVTLLVDSLDAEMPIEMWFNGIVVEIELPLVKFNDDIVNVTSPRFVRAEKI